MNNYVFISKEKEVGLSTDEVIDFFKNSNDLDEIKTAVENAQERLYVTWASVDVTDRDNENIPIEDVINQQDILLKRGGPVMDSHTNRSVGQTLAYKIMQHPEANKLGVLHLDRIFADNPYDDKVWGEIVSGEKTGSSVGGFQDKPPVFEFDEQSGKLRKRLEGFNQYETSIVKDRKSTRLNSSHIPLSRMPSSA